MTAPPPPPPAAAAAPSSNLSAPQPATMPDQHSSKDVAMEGLPSAVLDGKGPGGSAASSKRACFRCTRTKWAVCIIALVLAVAAVGVGVGLYFAFGRNKGSGSAPVVVPSPAPGLVFVDPNGTLPSLSPSPPPRPRPISPVTLPLPALDAVSNATGFAVALGRHIIQQDFDCGTGEPFCKLCNKSASDIANVCMRSPSCVAFVLDAETNCGYLKASAAPMDSSAVHVTYCLPGRGANCTSTGGSPVRFTYYPYTDIKDVGDYSCNQIDRDGTPQDFCFIIGSVSSVAATCLAELKCLAFVAAERYKQPGGFLKNVTGPLTSNALNTDLYIKTP